MTVFFQTLLKWELSDLYDDDPWLIFKVAVVPEEGEKHKSKFCMEMIILYALTRLLNALNDCLLYKLIKMYLQQRRNLWWSLFLDG